MQNNRNHDAPAEAKRTRAPYNFVPFANEVYCRYNSIKEVPDQSKWDEKLLSGEIVLTVTAKTPIYIANGKKDRYGADFFKGADGKYQIPGSTLRGLIRENMQILGLGLVRPGEDLDDVTLFYREFSAAKGSLKYSLRQKYERVIGIDSNKHYSNTENVRAGYLHYDSTEKVYRIVPTCDNGKFITIQKVLIKLGENKRREFFEENKDISQWKNKTSFHEPVWYKDKGEDVNGFARWDLRKEPADEFKSGTLVGVGHMQRQNNFYLFPEEDRNSKDVITIPGNDDIIIQYKQDYKNRVNTLGGTQKIKGQEIEQQKAFYKLPENDEVRPVFYVSIPGRRAFFGMARYFRIPNEKPLREGLPAKHVEWLKQEEPNSGTDSVRILDYPSSVFGFAGKNISLRSRVSVGDLTLQEGLPQIGNSFLAILSKPHPSFFAAYVQGGRDYNQRDYQLSGYKQYWLKEAPKPESTVNNENGVPSYLKPLPAGSTFSGRIRYTNLHPDELGLLLWCLTLDDGDKPCWQSLGMGKPYGYGRVSINIDELREYNPDKLYETFTCRPVASDIMRVKKLISDYQNNADPEKGPVDLMKMPEIEDFFYIHYKIRTDLGEISYMSLDNDDYRNLTVPLPSIREYRNRPKVKPTAAPIVNWNKNVEKGKITKINFGREIVLRTDDGTVIIRKDQIPDGDKAECPVWQEKGRVVFFCRSTLDKRKGTMLNVPQSN